MNISAYIKNILKCKECLEEKAEYALLVQSLMHIIDNIGFIEMYIDDDNPFKQHFYNFFKSDTINYEECFAVQEDIVLFFREKLLRVGISKMDSIEIKVLEDFENSQHDVNSFAATWYYEKLPLMMYKELNESVGFSGSPWNNRWQQSLKFNS